EGSPEPRRANLALTNEGVCASNAPGRTPGERRRRHRFLSANNQSPQKVPGRLAHDKISHSYEISDLLPWDSHATEGLNEERKRQGSAPAPDPDLMFNNVLRGKRTAVSKRCENLLRTHA